MYLIDLLRKLKNKFFIKQVHQPLPEQTANSLGYLIVGDKNYLNVGERVSFGGNVTLYLNHQLDIGNDTMIAINVTIHTSTHNYKNNPMWQHRIDRPVKIGSHVWIGLNAIILPGVIVEDYAVIAAGAVINRNVPKGAIVAGNPARIIKYRDLTATTLDTEIEYPGNIIKESYLTEVTKEKN